MGASAKVNESADPSCRRMKLLTITLFLVMIAASTQPLGARQPTLVKSARASAIPGARVSNDESATTKLKIEARLGKRSFANGERAQLVLWITNRSKELVTVEDPRRGGDSLRLKLRLPSGDERSFTTGEALSAPGVKQVLVPARLPPGVRQNFEFDLAQLTDLSQPGRYVLRLQYTWKSGEPAWHSLEMLFTITAAKR
jgi:hypothetical protein